ncbi:aldehyde dehydrogenase [Mycolicibacterium moriokaense]|uniref:Aldehyde dehydrogenase n=1 Tax=Mycolicibacterium moriokaense TaxID=39691 RepID=A0AAD1M4D0_9MYCO|nr:aldehyde dehydrogenase [Mycolicibacterium moriokaense]MCV7037864.1 aldehyde dehydrogenase [Mycolicibacterium moriokaense]ORB22161.1 aldehyde dehydrogenase [Mycolicibacterium moriokaense]BBW99193.1 aldehyde dehydrogenase [Mycolicibacterium moriokaense]
MKYQYTDLYLDGQWHKPSDAEPIPVISPITEQQICEVPKAATGDVDAAVTAATRALNASDWRDIGAEGRSAILMRLADELEANAAERASLTSAQNGMPIVIAGPAEGAGPVGILRYYAALAAQSPVEERRPRLVGDGETVVRREPVGVVAAIVPWNYPQALTMFKLAPALAAGCTVVLKPAPETTVDALELAAAVQRAGLPPGVVNVVTGGAEIGEYLVSHPGVQKVAFTGSTAAGRAIGEICGRLLRPATLELGGKSAAIVLDDADVAATAAGLATVSMLNNGQTCHLSTRILAPRSRYGEVVDAVAAMASSLTVGDPFDPTTFIGPLVSRRQRDRVESYIEMGKAGGATLVAGGSRPEQAAGWFVRPTVFSDVDNSSRIAREEIFGPVLAVIPYDDVDQAVSIANDSDYGLGGSVWTSDKEKGLDIARRVETGSIGVNFYDLDLGAPFGGFKGSGVGRELGPEGLAAYYELKSIYLQ